MSDDYAYGDLEAFHQWADRQAKRDEPTWNVKIECVYHYTEYGVFEGRGRSTLDPKEHGWFQFVKSFRDLDQAARYAKAKPHQFVIQREVYCEAWQ